ncbi:hypothetical protein ACWEP5_36520 [Nocardia niigatensis]
MNTVTLVNKSRDPEGRGPNRLPLRWAIIATWAAAAAIAGFLLAGPTPAIMAGCAVATAAHRLLD